MLSRTSVTVLALLAILACAGSAAAQPRYEIARSNDNRARAGLSSGNILAVRIEARIAVWHPNGEDQAGAAIPVFAEIGRPSQVPGPLIRVPGGTDVIATVRNTIPNRTITIHGLHARPAGGGAFNDSIQLVPGQVSTLRFRLDRPGTYYYWGTTDGQSFETRTGADAQLTGAIIVDEPGARAPRDRVFVIGMWADGAANEFNRHRERELFVVNGRAWPLTDRVIYERGDSVRWHVINASSDGHPMHLHGFHYRVNRRGDGRADTSQVVRDLVHTAYVPPGGTMDLSWLASRRGNWLFHCQEAGHTVARGAMGLPRPATTFQISGVPPPNPAAERGGLIVGVEIAPAEEDTAAALPLPEPVRRIRMLVRPNPGSTRSRPFYSVQFAETGEGAGPDPVEGIGQSAGAPLVLHRGEPVSIMVHNRTPEPTSIHWHGVEVDSYYDGVAGFSGVRPEVTPAIAPNDSFEVRLSPSRAGTFLYHAHSSARQQRAGVVGALLVVEVGAHDPARDIPVLISSPSDPAEEENAVLVNGRLAPDTIELQQGASYRLRLINITTGRPWLYYQLAQDSTLITWRVVAEDGVELPPTRRVVRQARMPITIGKTVDVEFFPTRAGDYRIELATPGGALLGALPIRVH
ncbi:MAG: multicopper oxidase domain-containing protein [Gemmatimonadaceae bacterium]